MWHLRPERPHWELPLAAAPLNKTLGEAALEFDKEITVTFHPEAVLIFCHVAVKISFAAGREYRLTLQPHITGDAE